MGLTSFCAKNPGLQKKQPFQLDIAWSVATGVPSLPTNALGYPVIFGVATNTGSLTQTAIDTFLGSTNEVVAATAFGGTAMGTDSLGFVVNMNGQCQAGLFMTACLYDNTDPVHAGAVVSSSALTDALTTAWAVTSSGNLYGRVVLTGLDAGSSPVLVRLLWYPK
jgi:hypothetical protein